MATITAQAITEDGINDATYATAEEGGDVFVNSGDQIIHFKNGSGGDIVATIIAQTTSIASQRYGTLTKANQTLTIEAGSEAFIGTFPQSIFNATNGEVEMTYDDITSLTLAVFTVKHSQ